MFFFFFFLWLMVASHICALHIFIMVAFFIKLPTHSVNIYEGHIWCRVPSSALGKKQTQYQLLSSRLWGGLRDRKWPWKMVPSTEVPLVCRRTSETDWIQAWEDVSRGTPVSRSEGQLSWTKGKENIPEELFVFIIQLCFYLHWLSFFSTFSPNSNRACFKVFFLKCDVIWSSPGEIFTYFRSYKPFIQNPLSFVLLVQKSSQVVALGGFIFLSDYNMAFCY